MAVVPEDSDDTMTNTRLQQSCNGSASAPGAPGTTTTSSSASSSAGPLSVASALAAQRTGLAQALEELARGEQAADKLEAELGAFETKLEQLLGLLGVSEQDLASEDDQDHDAETKEDVSPETGDHGSNRIQDAKLKETAGSKTN